MTDVSVELISAIGALIAFCGLIIEHFHYQAGLQERLAKAEQQLKTMEQVVTDVTEIRTKVELFWTALERQLPGMLLKGNPIEEGSELFCLLDKYRNGTTTAVDKRRLVCLLEEEETLATGHNPGEILAMVLLTSVIRGHMEDARPCSP
jgi:hypothetical protein